MGSCWADETALDLNGGELDPAGGPAHTERDHALGREGRYPEPKRVRVSLSPPEAADDEGKISCRSGLPRSSRSTWRPLAKVKLI